MGKARAGTARPSLHSQLASAPASAFADSQHSPAGFHWFPALAPASAFADPEAVPAWLYSLQSK
eukprot:9947121-Alexandrium_andersonii.AAC.1